MKSLTQKPKSRRVCLKGFVILEIKLLADNLLQPEFLISARPPREPEKTVSFKIGLHQWAEMKNNAAKELNSSVAAIENQWRFVKQHATSS